MIIIFKLCYTIIIQVRLNKNYRSTRCIIEAASSLIRNNRKRCQLKDVLTDNSSGSKVIYLFYSSYEKNIFDAIWYLFCSWLLNYVTHNAQITIKECHTEDAQCSFVVDKILETASNGSASNCSYENIAILYRRQVTISCHSKVFMIQNILKYTDWLSSNVLCYRYQEKSSKWLSVRGKYLLIFMASHSIGKRFWHFFSSQRFSSVSFILVDYTEDVMHVGSLI